MGNEKYYERRWICAGINKIIVYILSLIWFPLLLNFLGLEVSQLFDLGIGFISCGVYWRIDRKYKTSEKFNKKFENLRFTIGFSIFTILLLGVLLRQNDGKKGSN